MKDNIAAVLQVIRFIYDNIMYAELNTKSDYCQECGYDGEIQIITDEEGKLVWECPHCGNRNRGYTECCKTYLRLYWNTVLESGKNPGD